MLFVNCVHTLIWSMTYKKTRLDLFNFIKVVKYIALTSDCWSSRVADSYMTITCHFIYEGKLHEFEFR